MVTSPWSSPRTSPCQSLTQMSLLLLVTLNSLSAAKPSSSSAPSLNYLRFSLTLQQTAESTLLRMPWTICHRQIQPTLSELKFLRHLPLLSILLFSLTWTRFQLVSASTQYSPYLSLHKRQLMHKASSLCSNSHHPIVAVKALRLKTQELKCLSKKTLKMRILTTTSWRLNCLRIYTSKSISDRTQRTPSNKSLHRLSPTSSPVISPGRFKALSKEPLRFLIKFRSQPFSSWE